MTKYSSIQTVLIPFKTSDSKDTKEDGQLDDIVRKLRKNCELTADELSFERINADPDLFECLNV